MVFPVPSGGALTLAALALRLAGSGPWPVAFALGWLLGAWHGARDGEHLAFAGALALAESARLLAVYLLGS